MTSSVASRFVMVQNLDFCTCQRCDCLQEGAVVEPNLFAVLVDDLKRVGNQKSDLLGDDRSDVGERDNFLRLYAEDAALN
jgi:hypothetical protein